MRTSRQPLWLATMLAIVDLGVAGCANRTSDPTSLVVRIESDLSPGVEIDRIVVNDHAPIPIRIFADLPVTVAFTPAGALDQPVTVTAVGYRGADLVVEQSVSTQFQAGAVALVVLHLDRACLGRICTNPAQTCSAGDCASNNQTATPYPQGTDAGVDARRELGDGSASDGRIDGPGDGSPPAICGDGVIEGSEVCDDFNTSDCGTCNASCSAAHAASSAIGSITAVAPALLVNGETFTLSDGVHPSVTFEFNSGTVAAGHVAIPTLGVFLSQSASVTAQLIVSAVNSVGPSLAIIASDPSPPQVLLVNKLLGATGNVAIDSTVHTPEFQVSGMAGGFGYDCAAGISCAADADCASRVCCVTGTRAGAACAKNTCLASSCSDKVLNGLETATDCGGPTCGRCPDMSACVTASDCTSKVCTGFVCQVPTCTDGVQNGDETGVDTGGMCAGGGSCFGGGA